MVSCVWLCVEVSDDDNDVVIGEVPVDKQRNLPEHVEILLTSKISILCRPV